MRLLITFIISFFLSGAFGQDFVYPEINPKGFYIADFVPAGWEILDSTSGDLNNDAIPDAAVIVQHRERVLLVNSTGDTVLSNPRILLILIRNPADNGFTLAEQSNTFILMDDDPARDDPYQNMVIVRNALEIKFHLFYYRGSWYVTTAFYTFSYQKNQLVLITAGLSTFHRATRDSEYYSYNFLTGEAVSTKSFSGTESKGSNLRSLKIPELKTLRTFCQPFTWLVEPGVYL